MNTSKIKLNKIDLISLIIVLIPIVMTIFVYQKLPDELAVHFGINGEPDGYQGKRSFLLLNILMLFGIPILLKIIRYIDPKKRNYEKFEATYDMFRLLITIFLSFMVIAILLFNLGFSINIQMVVLIGIGIIFMFFGNYMSRIRFNYMVGIRTPWTLANEEVWRRTHRLGGPLWFIGGIAIIFIAFLPGKMAFIFMMVLTAIITFIPVIYSFILYKKLDQQ